MIPKAIVAEGLMRKFGDFTAVDGVSFTVEQGEIFGFLGPNGAGKTTTIHMLCTLLRPTAGTAKVGGFDVRRQPDEVRRAIGLVFQDPSLDEKLTAWENLRFHALLYHVPRRTFQARAAELLNLVGLAEHASRPVETFSGGMKRRLEIARGLLHRPKVLFLDEPTLGLDPQTRRHLWEHIRELREREGVTIFLTTHYMEEADALCDRVAIIDHGRIIALDSPEALKAQVGGDVVRLCTSDDGRAARELKEALRVEVRRDRGPDGEGLLLEVPDGEQTVPQIVRLLADSKEPIEVLSIGVRRPTLEDVFVKLTGHAIREEEADARDVMRRHGRLWRRARTR